MPVIGFLDTRSPDAMTDRLRAFREGLKDSGYVERENVAIEYRWGLVASLARPGGNLTGINLFSGELTAKRLEFLREMVPGAARIAVLVNPANATTTETTLRDVQGLDVFLNSRRAQLVNLASRHAVPATFSNRDFAEIGGLMSYG